jgi:hypothetical protein
MRLYFSKQPASATGRLYDRNKGRERTNSDNYQFSPRADEHVGEPQLSTCGCFRGCSCAADYAQWPAAVRAAGQE